MKSRSKKKVVEGKEALECLEMRGLQAANTGSLDDRNSMHQQSRKNSRLKLDKRFSRLNMAIEATTGPAKSTQAA